MLTEIHLPQQRIGWPALSALVSGVVGLLANALLVLFYLLARPFSEVQNGFGWLGTANDWLVAVQFLTMIPVALELRRRLPLRRSVRVVTAMGVVAMAAACLLQLLLIAGALDFDVEVLLVVAAFLLFYAWVFVVSSIGHRQGALPRTVTRFGLLLGAGFPLGLLITGAGYLVGRASGHPLALASPGIVLGAASWLALPVWPLILARIVFNKPPSLNSDEEGLS